MTFTGNNNTDASDNRESRSVCLQVLTSVCVVVLAYCIQYQISNIDATGSSDTVLVQCADVTFNYLFIALPLSRNAVKPNSSDTATQLLVLISASM
ncbi:hypothetical protein HID58_085215 [Brassica napus]|uniref:BnaC09g09510D protein n=2 Tax=Brassica napus TaxID=3708 RepID=A0A078CKT7_BRANA|nr:hypothetical protein HID58_085215 [Brassica napus]CAF1718008.1 unnamed protein product [Brassica napus]CDY26824.1 BnaC09g09510D [Brassica napus]